MIGKSFVSLFAGIILGAACSAQPFFQDDFETDLAKNWKGIGKFWTSSKNAASGSCAVQRIFYPKTKEGTVCTLRYGKTIPVPQGRFGFSIRASSGVRDESVISQHLALEFFDNAGKSLGTQTHPLTSDSGKYTLTCREIEVPAGAAAFRPELQAQYQKTQEKIAYVRFDDLKIAPWEELSPQGTEENGLDLLFERKGSGWKLDNSLWRVAGKAQSGNGCVEFVSPADGVAFGTRAALQSEALIPVQAGKEYRFSYFVSSSDLTLSTKQSVEITFLDAAGKAVGSTASRPIIPPRNFWTESAKLITPPANAVSAQLTLHVVAMKDIPKPFRSRFDSITLPLWEVEKLRGKPRGTPPKPVKLEDPDSGKVTEGCLSIGKFYQAESTPMPGYPDRYPNQWTLGTKLTDGKINSGTDFRRDSYVGWKGSDPLVITVDLGRAQTLENAEVSGFKEQEANFVIPASFTVSVSDDKTNWKEWSSWKNTADDQPNGSYRYSVKAPGVKTRYVRLTLCPPKENTILMLDEITLNGKIKNTWKYVPANGTYHGAFPPTYGFKEPLRAGKKTPMALDIYEKLVGKKLSMVLWYQAMSPERSFSEFQSIRLNEMAENNYGQRFMSMGWLPHAPIRLQDIVSGKLDEYFTEYFSDSIDEVYTYGNQNPIWMRPMNEFNGGWVNWGIDPENFLPAWRRMYNIAEQVGAAEYHVFVWSPNHRSYPDVEWNKMEKYYPGDQYLDWVGISCYPPSRHFVKTDDEMYPILRCKELHDKFGDRKPLMIAEGGYSFAEEGHRLRWVKEWFEFQKVYPNFKAMIWENHANRVIQDGGKALELYREKVQDPYWISETYLGE